MVIVYLLSTNYESPEYEEYDCELSWSFILSILSSWELFCHLRPKVHALPSPKQCFLLKIIQDRAPADRRNYLGGILEVVGVAQSLQEPGQCLTAAILETPAETAANPKPQRIELPALGYTRSWRAGPSREAAYPSAAAYSAAFATRLCNMKKGLRP